MPAPLLPQMVESVRALLAAGLSHRQIARRTRLGRTTILRIARRRYRTSLRACDIHDDRPPGFERRNLSRCPGCGARVYLWPCMQCDLAADLKEREEIRRIVRKTPSLRRAS